MGSQDIKDLKVEGSVDQGSTLLEDHDHNKGLDLGGRTDPQDSNSTFLTEIDDGNTSPTLSRIVEDLREYEITEDSFSFDRGSPSSSSTSDSDTPTIQHLDFADEQAEEFPFGRPLPPIPVTSTVDPLRHPPSPLPLFHFPAQTPPPKMPNSNVPKPGPAKLSPRAGLDEWLAEAKQCHYLPEAIMKQLCEMVKECLMEGEYLAAFDMLDLLLT
jgi:hypothetical protein